MMPIIDLRQPEAKKILPRVFCKHCLPNGRKADGGPWAFAESSVAEICIKSQHSAREQHSIQSHYEENRTTVRGAGDHRLSAPTGVGASPHFMAQKACAERTRHRHLTL